MDRQEFLTNIRRQLETARLPEAAVERPRPLALPEPTSRAAMVEQFVQEVELVSGHVHRVDSAEAALNRLEALFEQYNARGYLGWDAEHLPFAGVHDFLAQRGYERGKTRIDDRSADQNALAHYKIGITGAMAGIADTGSVMLQMGAGRGRLASLLPLVHVVLMTTGQIVPTLNHFIRDNARANFDSSNVVAVTGPSRTGDIGGVLTLGVHGPKEVHIILNG